MITISLCMIVKNEEETLARCLNSVQEIVDEIIIVDTGSVDLTKKIASEFTDKIFDFQWIDDFSAARNESFSKAAKEYILWLDADDILLPEDIEKFKHLKQTLSSDVDVVMMQYNTVFDKQGRPTFSYKRERLVKRISHFLWKEPVHEYIQMNGKIINSDIAVTHAKPETRVSNRNIQIYEKQLENGKPLSIRGMYYYSKELKDHGRHEEAIKQFEQFLNTGNGWVEDNIVACQEMAKCYKALGDEKNALLSMFRSFYYDNPRAETCCQIAYFFKSKNEYDKAIFWFEQALNLKKPMDGWGFIQNDCWGYIPSIECAVCYDRLGNHELAEKFNNKAAEFKPDCPSVLSNKNYFESLKNNRH
ncbi:glycosyltransferase [Clostridium aminobutyricum]|uniref:Glycosyltransferase n=1 Tax=Clostridium aminobutyricum TaxID=33953 RepID=A0A939IG50_CLOAM|nr:glycosyltransferase [Clostridium aminobutyricum]MBN7772600.1 glycosyltransferase [Clostridium aminobutyricum]